MAWVWQQGQYTIGGSIELTDDVTEQQLDSTETRLLIAPIRVQIDPNYNTGTVDIYYSTDGGTTFFQIRTLANRETDILDEFKLVTDVYFKPSVAQAGTYIFWSASTDEPS